MFNFENLDFDDIRDEENDVVHDLMVCERFKDSLLKDIMTKREELKALEQCFIAATDREEELWKMLEAELEAEFWDFFNTPEF